jgi:hypothetical protein
MTVSLLQAAKAYFLNFVEGEPEGDDDPKGVLVFPNIKVAEDYIEKLEAAAETCQVPPPPPFSPPLEPAA